MYVKPIMMKMREKIHFAKLKYNILIKFFFGN